MSVVRWNVDPREVLVELDVGEVSRDLIEKATVGSSDGVSSGGGNGLIGDIVVSPRNGPKYGLTILGLVFSERDEERVFSSVSLVPLVV